MKKTHLSAILVLGVCCILVLVLGAVKSQNDSNTETLTEHYYEKIKEIREEFSFEGFAEVMQDRTNIMALPMEYPQINENGIFLDLQKLLVYKNDVTGTTVFLQITCDPMVYTGENQWLSSMSYSAEMFNLLNIESYDTNTPKVEIASNSFSYCGIVFSTLVFSNENSEPSAAAVLLDFSNKLITFLVEKQ